MSVRFTLPVKTVSELNVREHWSAKAKRAKSQRGAAYLYARAHGGNAYRDAMRTLVVTITRIAPRDLDCDNLAGSQKHVRDGVADALGIDDRDARVTWRYAQRRGGKGRYAVEVRIDPAEGS